MMKRIAYALTGFILSAAVALGASLPLITGPQDPSQLNATFNALIQQLNGYAGYTTASPIVGIGAFCQNAAAGATPQTAAASVARLPSPASLWPPRAPTRPS